MTPPQAVVGWTSPLPVDREGRDREPLRWPRLLRDEQGQSLTEYSLVLVLVAVAVWLLLQAMGVTVVALFTQIVNVLTGA